MCWQVAKRRRERWSVRRGVKREQEGKNHNNSIIKPLQPATGFHIISTMVEKKRKLTDTEEKKE